MAGRRSSIMAVAAAVALFAAACGSSGGTGSGGGSSASGRGSTTTTDGAPGTLDSATVLDAGTGSALKAYVAGLGPVWRQVRLANRAAADEARIASSGDFPALAADSRTVALHLGRAVAAARNMHVAPGLARPHADLVRALAVGRRMAGRLATLYDHIGPDARRDYRRNVLPLEKRSLRLANRWYGFMQGAMLAEHVREPRFIGHLFDWT